MQLRLAAKFESHLDVSTQIASLMSPKMYVNI